MIRTKILFGILVLSTFAYACAGTSGARPPSPENPYENIHTFVRYIKINHSKQQAWQAWSPIVATEAGTYSAEKIILGRKAREVAEAEYEGVRNRRRTKTPEDVRNIDRKISVQTSATDYDLYAKRLKKRVSQIEVQITEFCSEQRKGKLHTQEIIKGENAPIYARRMPNRKTMQPSESRYLCISQSDGAHALQFLIDASFETKVNNGQRKTSMNLHTMEPGREHAASYLENWVPTEQ